MASTELVTAAITDPVRMPTCDLLHQCISHAMLYHSLLKKELSDIQTAGIARSFGRCVQRPARQKYAGMICISPRREVP
jgi:hypothetical protein